MTTATAETTTLLALPRIQPGQAQKHVTHNEALQILDAAVQLRVLSFDAIQPPAAPAPGDTHALGMGTTGAWAGQDGRLAHWDGTGWLFLSPRDGWRAWDMAGGVLRAFTGGVWRPLVPVLQDVEGLGVGTAFDSTNRLAVAAPATLLSHAGGGHQIKVNKAGPTDTASLLFQSGWTGHAELGLSGGLDFSLKVGDGATWTTALGVAHDSGIVTLPQGATVNGPVTGTAVQSSPADGTPGRLMTVGAFGLGGPLPSIVNPSVIDGSLVPGLYVYDTASGSSGGPMGVTRATLLHSRRGTAAGETQLLVVESGNVNGMVPGLVFGRARTGGGWSNWTCGSLQESVSTASGRSLRQQDGTQTCWHSLTTSSTAEVTWTFPQPFVNTTGLVVLVSVSSASLVTLTPRHWNKTATQVGISVSGSSNTRVSTNVDVMAIGRWF